MIARYARLSLLAALAITGLMLLGGVRLWGRSEGRLPAANPRAAAVTPVAAGPAGAAAPAGAKAAEGTGADPMAAAQALLERDPKNAVAWRDMGRLLAGRRDYLGAAEAFAEAVALAPEDARLRNDLGSALLYLGLVRVARAQFERSVAIDGAYPDARFNLAITLSHMQPPDTAGALQEWRRVVEMAPGADVAKMAQGYIDQYGGAKKPDAAPPPGTPSATPARPGGN